MWLRWLWLLLLLLGVVLLRWLLLGKRLLLLWNTLLLLLLRNLLLWKLLRLIWQKLLPIELLLLGPGRGVPPLLSWKRCRRSTGSLTWPLLRYVDLRLPRGPREGLGDRALCKRLCHHAEPRLPLAAAVVRAAGSDGGRSLLLLLLHVRLELLLPWLLLKRLLRMMLTLLLWLLLTRNRGLRGRRVVPCLRACPCRRALLTLLPSRHELSCPSLTLTVTLWLTLSLRRPWTLILQPALVHLTDGGGALLLVLEWLLEGRLAAGGLLGMWWVGELRLVASAGVPPSLLGQHPGHLLLLCRQWLLGRVLQPQRL